MEENRLLEAMWREAQQVEIPPELEPEQMKERICKQQQENKSENRNTTKASRFRWHSYGSRVAAAAVVLAVSFGTFSLAGHQTSPVGDQANGAVVSGAAIGQVAGDEKASSEQDMTAETADGSASPDGSEKLVSAAELGGYHRADSYEAVGKMFEVSREEMSYGSILDFAVTEDRVSGGTSASGAMKKEFAEADTAPAGQNAVENNDFSTTNLQVQGVDESDIVKTDGHYIYIASDKQVRIVDTSNRQVRQLGSITPKLEGNLDRIREMYVSGERLVLIVQTEDTEQLGAGTAYPDLTGSMKQAYVVDDVWYRPGNRMHTRVFTYDISIPAGAKLMGTFEQDGSYYTSRKIGDQVYLFTSYYANAYNIYAKMIEEQDADVVTGQTESETQKDMHLDEDDVKNVLPKVQGQTIPADCIYLPGEKSQGGIVIASFNVNQPEAVCDRKMIFSGYSTVYVTLDSVILYRTEYSETMDNSTTALTKFRIADGQIVADCAESVVGEISDTFAIHENGDGYLYVLTTDYTTNWLYVLDEKLKIKGQIDHIADGESVYAARFVDDIGYFVTYRNMDPLFTVDFSDPAKPKLIGELEIPGFSDYLQFWDDTHLIGVGEERKAKDSEFVGMKLSLYDISDPTNVTESDKVVFKDACGAPAAYNYKALLADSTKNVIAFLTDDKGENNHISERIYCVADGKLQKQCTERIVESEDYSRDSDAYRNVYIGDYLYLVCADQIIVYDMADGYIRTGSYDLQ